MKERLMVVEARTTVQGQERWVAYMSEHDKRYLILHHKGQYSAIPLYCPHGKVSLLKAPLQGDHIVCSSHGLKISVTDSIAAKVRRTEAGDFWMVEALSPLEPLMKDNVLMPEVENINPNTNEEVQALQLANRALQKQVKSSMGKLDSMLQHLETQKHELSESNVYLHRTNELIDGVMNSINELIVVTDNHGKIIRINKTASDVLQIADQSIIGSSPDELITQESLSQLRHQVSGNQWDNRPVLYQMVYRNTGFEEEVCFSGEADSDKSYLLKGSLLYSSTGKEEGMILTAADISVVKAKEMKKRQQDLETHLVLLNATLASLGQGVGVFSSVGHLKVWNRLFSTLTGCSSDLLDDNPCFRDLVDYTRDQVDSEKLPLDSHLTLYRQQWVQYRKDETILDFESYPMPDGGFLLSVRDITATRKREQHIHLLSKTVEQSSTEVIVTDVEGTVVYVNPQFTKNTGYEADEILGQNANLIQSGQMSPGFYHDLWRTIKHGKRWQGEVINRKKNGEAFWQWMNITPIKDEDGQVTHYLSLKTDITEQKKAEQKLRYQAEHDALTQLSNRTLFLTSLEREIQNASDRGHTSAILFMDLDNFKDINDTLGHLSGDQLLKNLARRLVSATGEGCLVSRLGGDEFAVLINQTTEAEVRQMADQIIKVVNEPFRLGDHLLRIGISIGITLYPNDGRDSSTLMKNADMSMYMAKKNSGSRYQFYDSALHEQLQRRRSVEIHLHQAVEKEEFSLVYQPKIQISSGQIVGAEALIRWNSERLGFVSPDEFISVAELSGQIIEIGMWVVRSVIKTILRWRDLGIDAPKIAFNLSAIQLRDQHFTQDLAAELQHFGLDAGALEIEITETAAMSEPEVASDHLTQLQNMGFTIAMDDFGTGYSSLSYLSNLPINRVKIDRSFVSNLDTSRSARAIIESIIQMSKVMDKRVIAEGVETESQLTTLKSLGCDEAQGYLIARPLSERDFCDFLTTH